MSQQLELLTENLSQWTSVSFVTPEIQKKEIKPFVVLALKELEGTPDSRIASLKSADKFAAVRAIVRHVARLRSAQKEAWRPDDVKIFLEGLRFSPESAEEFTSLLCTEKMYDSVPQHLMVKPGLVSLQWKIDVSLCQSNTTSPQYSKALLQSNTYIIMLMKLTDGTTKTYRLSLTKFHELRYVVASALKSLIVLEKRKCMRKD